MSAFRLSKKNIHRDSRLTIDAVHEKKMNEFEEREKNLYKYEKELIILEKEITDEKIKNNNILRVRLIDRIDKLKNDISAIKNNTDMVEYLFKASQFFNENNENNDENDIEIKKINNGKKYRDFLNVCFNEYSQVDCEITRDINKCAHCGDNKLEIDHKHNLIVCSSCGVTETTFSSDIEWSLYETHEPIQVFNYKRKNHFKEWLIQLQAKENTNIPDDLINKIYLEMKKERITDIDRLTYDKIKMYMSKHNYNKYFEHIPYIYKMITNKKPIELDEILENKLYEMFDEIQIPFDNHKHLLKNRTKNFLSYSFTIYKFCQLLGRTDLLKFFNLLKDREKIFEQEVVWKHICQDLNWEYIRG